MLRLYWINFIGEDSEELPAGTTMGIGATASNKAEAEEFVRRAFFSDTELPSHIVTIIEKLDDLDQHHVRPNMGNHMAPGVWFPAIRPWNVLSGQ
jgi:hypothetical protein